MGKNNTDSRYNFCEWKIKWAYQRKRIIENTLKEFEKKVSERITPEQLIKNTFRHCEFMPEKIKDDTAYRVMYWSTNKNN